MRNPSGKKTRLFSKVFRLSFVLIPLLQLSACNSGTSSTVTNPTANTHAGFIDPCTLLTKAEAEAALGQSIILIKADTLTYQTRCTYTTGVTATQILPGRIILVNSTSAKSQALGPAKYTSPLAFAAGKNALPSTSIESVSGIGDDAFWQKSNKLLWFYKGDVLVTVNLSISGAGIDTTVAAFTAAKTVGTQIAAKL